MIERSPMRSRRTAARSARPISRWISCDRPDGLRSPRVLVARGSIAYSAVTQPSPEPRRKGAVLSSKLALHSTRVSPARHSTLPSA
jgi:hypothetical protein